jgi:hypothetical protein
MNRAMTLALTHGERISRTYRLSQQTIALLYNVSQRAISMVTRGETWGD